MALDNNSSSEDVFITSGLFTYVSAPFWTAPSFAIPVAQSDEHGNATYVQRVDDQNRILGFELFSQRGQLSPLKERFEARTGGEEIFALIDPGHVVRAGTRRALVALIKTWLSSVDHPLTRMNFARFCGDHRMAQESARLAVRHKTDQFGSKDEATRWFLSSVVVTELFKLLARRQRREYDSFLLGSDFTFHLDNGPRIIIEVPGTLLDRSTKKKRGELTRLLMLTNIATGRDVDLKAGKFEPERRKSHPSTDDQARLTQNILQYGRQEQRLGVLMHALLTSEPGAWDVFRLYNDKAGFAQQVLGHLRQIIGPTMDEKELRFRLAKSISDIVSTAYPQQRGQLLLDFADILGSYRAISDVIRNITVKSNQNEVVKRRAAILDALNHSDWNDT